MFNLWTAISNVTLYFFSFIISFFPLVNEDLLFFIDSSLSTFKTTLASVDWIFPVSNAFLVLSFIFLCEASLFTYKLVRYIAAHLSFGFIKE